MKLKPKGVMSKRVSSCLEISITNEHFIENAKTYASYYKNQHSDAEFTLMINASEDFRGFTIKIIWNLYLKITAYILGTLFVKRCAILNLSKSVWKICYFCVIFMMQSVLVIWMCTTWNSLDLNINNDGYENLIN